MNLPINLVRWKKRGLAVRECLLPGFRAAARGKATVGWNSRARLLLIVPLLVILNASSPATASAARPHIELAAAERAEIRNGDIIFRKATGLGSQYILSVDSASEYSHSGILHRAGEQITVIHAAPGENLLGGQTREEPIESFLENIPLAAIYRLRSDLNGSAERAVQTAKTLIGAPFDANLDLGDARSLYCTELVWLSYKQAGIDLVDGHFDHLNLPLAGRGDYILPSSLVDSHWLYQVMILKAPNSSGG